MRRMSRETALQQLRACCNEISRVVTAMHPEVPKLGHPGVQGEILRALFELTRSVEVVKKQVLKLEKGDETKVL